MFEFIEKVVYINLEHRNDRRKHIEEQLSIFPPEKIERFNAVYEPQRGHLGCSKSHIEVLKLAIHNNWNNVLVVEDDMQFNNFDESYKILKNLGSNPYDVIVLGGTALICDTNSYRLYNCCCTTGYIVANHYYSKLLKNFEEGASLLDKNYTKSGSYAIDQYWHSLQRIDNWYCIFPVLCKQISDYSDIEKTHINKEMHNNKNVLSLSPKFLTVNLMGGIGNQLFQLAFLLYCSKITERPTFLETLASPSGKHSSEQYFNNFLQKWRFLHSQKHVDAVLKENHTLHDEDWRAKINSNKGNVKLYGYFQRYQFVDEVREEFLSRLKFDDGILKKYPDISNKIVIHVRGGVYKNNAFHELNLTNYYKKCIEACKGESFMICTNDIPYAKQLVQECDFIQENEVDTLYLMSKAKGIICANSTFSWWGAYLNPNRPIFMPSKWYNDPKMSISGYYFHGSKIVEV